MTMATNDNNGNLTEIERKYLCNPGYDYSVITKSKGTRIRQHYLSYEGKIEVRVRSCDDLRFFITIKSSTPALERFEFEKEIDLHEYTELKKLSVCSIEKTRYRYTYDGKTFEIDVYDNGLVTAEVELKDKSETVNIPFFCIKEVTGNPMYSNKSMAQAKRMETDGHK